MYFYYDHRSNNSVLEDGTSVVGQLQEGLPAPGRLPISQDTQTKRSRHNSHDSNAMYAMAGAPDRRHEPQTAPEDTGPDIGTQDLTEQLRTASIRSNPTAKTPASECDTPKDESETRPVSSVHTGYNPQTLVTSNVQMDDPQRFTDPILQRQGILSYRKLLGSSGDYEILDPSKPHRQWDARPRTFH